MRSRTYLAILQLWRIRGIHLAVGVGIVCGITSTGAFGRQPKMNRDSNGLYGVQCFASYSLFEALRCDASIYQCQYVSHHADSIPGKAIEYGQIILTVSNTLFGSPAKRLVLPYSRLSPDRPGHDYFAIWPDPTKLKAHAELFVVVVPHTYDRTAAVIPGVDSAASHVYLATPADGAFMERIGSIEKLYAGGGQRKILAEAHAGIGDPDRRIRDYTGDLLLDLLDTSPDSVIEMLSADAMGAKQGAPGPSAFSAIALLGRSMRDGSRPVKVRIAACRGLALAVADSRDKSLRSAAAWTLAVLVAPESFSTPTVVVVRGPAWKGLPFTALDALSPAEIGRLRASVAQLA